MLITGYYNDVRLSPEDANSFGGMVAQLEIHKRFRRGLDHECYSEGCDFEEVTETLSGTEAVSSAQIFFVFWRNNAFISGRALDTAGHLRPPGISARHI